jgi:hypothetical protein
MNNYKKLLRHLILLSLLLGLILFPGEKVHALDILKCLGTEELILHKKKLTGPLYALNQEFINELSSWGHVNIKLKELNDICSNKDFSPSVSLLQHFLIYGNSFFSTKTKNLSVATIALQKSLLDALVLKIPNIFFGYLSSLQGLATDPKCLNKEIPEINFYIFKFKYLEDEISSAELLKDKKKINNIFEKIKSLDSILEKCSKKKS